MDLTKVTAEFTKLSNAMTSDTRTIPIDQQLASQGPEKSKTFFVVHYLNR
jgi:hypothetical protein